MKKAYISIILLFLGACSKEDEKLKEMPPPAVTVVVADVIQKDVPFFVNSIGNIVASTVVEIRPQVDGELLTVDVKEGQEVEKGQLLFTIEPQPFEDELLRAEGSLKKDEALLQFANQKLERYKELLKGEYVSKLNYEEYIRDAEVNQAQILIDKAEINLAKVHLSHAKIVAPIDGLLSQLGFDPGNIVKTANTTPLTIIRQISPAKVSFSIPQKYFTEIQKYQSQGELKFYVLPPSQNDLTSSHIGSVTFIDNNIDPTTGTILLKGFVENRDKSLWPGEFVEVRLQLKIFPQALVVPQSAVQRSQEGYFIYVVNADMMAKVVPVTILEDTGQETAISGDLKAGDKVVIDGQINLSDGVLVHYSI